VRRLVSAALLALAVSLAIGFGTRAPVGFEPREAAALRFSWRVASQPIEHCRTPSPEEQAALPVHMRQREICERRLASFRLLATLDGRTVLEERVEPHGAQRDRPGYVLHELRVAPGEHALSVQFVPEREDIAAPRPLEATVSLRAGDVALVTLDATRAAFEIRR
jgi:hypothetical protein